MLRRFPLVAALALGALLASCTIQDVPVNGTVEVVNLSVVYDGTPVQPEFEVTPSGALVGVAITITPTGAEPLPVGTWPVDAGTYQVVVEAGPSVDGGRGEGTLTIEPRPVTVAPHAAQAKLVGEADPEFTFDATGLVLDHVLEGSLAREPGETIGTYAFGIGTLGAGPNYTVELAADSPAFTVALSVLGDGAITVTDATIGYDGDEHAVTIVFDPLEAGVGAIVTYGDLPAGTRPVDAGLYPVRVVAGPGYVGEADGTLTIDARAAIVAPDADQGKTYGDEDPAFAYTTTNLVAGDALDGALAREPGDVVGVYAFDLGTLDAGANYVLELAADAPDFAISARPLTLTGFAVDPKVYDGTIVASGAAFEDDRVDGDALAFDFDVAFDAADAGPAIAVSFSNIVASGDDASNYTLITTSGATTAAIAPRPLAVAGVLWADKVYDGDTVAAASATLVTDGVLDGDDVALAPQLVGSFASASVGNQAIVGSFQLVGDAAANYVVQPQPTGSAAIEARAITLSGFFAVATKPYDGDAETGAVDPSGLVLNGLVDGDDVAIDAFATFGDALVGDGKLATLTDATALIGADAGNYALSLADAPTATGSLAKAEIAFGITIAGTDLATQVVYDGDRTFQPNVTTSLAPVPSDVPVAYYVEIAYDPTGGSVGSFNPVGTYTVTVTADDPRYEGDSTQALEVLARPITIASSGTGKDYGTGDPAMRPSLADGTFGRNDGFVLEGALGYVAGEQETPYSAGSYPLELGSVAIVRGVRNVTANYAIAFASDFEIEPATVTVSPLAEQGKTYGDPDPVLAYLASGLLDGDALEGALGREDGEDVASYAFTLGDLDAGANYALVLETEAPSFAIASRPITLTNADPAFTYGDADLDLTAVLADGSTLREGDALAGALALSEAGAGAHAFLLGTAALTRDDADVASNYAVAFAEYAMAARSATVSPLADQGKTYGDADPVFDYAADLLDGDALTGALGREAGEDVGAYAFTLGDLANPNYALELVDAAPTFAVAARPITLEATDARKEFSTPDPDLRPVLAEGSTLRDGDAFVGALAHVGIDVGRYPLAIGSVQVMRGDGDVGGNYAITLGSFAIDSLPVTFDLTNADLVLDGDARTHVFFGDGSEPVRGLTVAVTPDGATPSFRFTYRWTHDADSVAFASPVTVQRIQGLGTYQVTVTATSANHVGQTVLTVWVTDAIGVAFAEPTYEALVGATVPTQVQLIAADGSPRAAGPAPLVLALASDAAHVAFATGEAPASSTTVTIASGASAAGVDLVAVTLGAAPAGLTATVADASGPDLASGTATFATTARLAFAPAAIDLGAGATTDAVTVRLLGFEDAPALAPADLQVDLTSDPADVVFRNAADDADVSFATIASGASQASFRMRSATAGAYAIAGDPDGALAGVTGADGTFDVAPAPVVASIEPGSVAKAQTVDLVLTGTGFADGVVVSFSGGDVTVDSVTVDSATQVTVRVTIAATTAVGARSVTVDNLDGGRSTTEDALVLTVPTLTANDDGPFGVVEGGNRTLSIATDLLANDGWTGTSAWGFDGVVSASGVTYGVAGGVLTVTAAADTGGSNASLTYRVRDSAFGTTATATVAIDVTLAPLEAILFTDPLEFDDFLTTEYTVPTFADIFATWPRVNNSAYYADSTRWSGTAADAWYYTEDALGDRVVFPNNGGYDGIVSQEAFEYYSHEATVYSSNSDDDSIGLIVAFAGGSGGFTYLVAHRTNAGNAPSSGWGLSYFNGSYVQTLVTASVPGFTTFRNGIGSGWQQSGASRIKVERAGDLVRLYASDWFTADVGTATPAYAPESQITIDLSTDEITYYSGSGFQTVTSAFDLDGLRGAQRYGYYVSSQADTSYLNIAFEGGAATDTAILLTAYDAELDAYAGSEVWRFADTWSRTGETIQTELNFPRDVTSVAKPNPGSSYPGGYSVFGNRFRIEATKVVPIID